MQGSKGYTVLSPIKVGGIRRKPAAHIEHDEIDEITAEGLIAGAQLAYADDIIEPDQDAGFAAAASAFAAEDAADMANAAAAIEQDRVDLAGIDSATTNTLSDSDHAAAFQAAAEMPVEQVAALKADVEAKLAGKSTSKSKK